LKAEGKLSFPIACEAIKTAKRLELRYDGHTRVVEVHAVGVSKDGHSIMRAWQVRGGSSGNKAIPWKLFRLDEATGLQIIDEKSEAPRDGYKRGDRAMARIVCEL
jgi:predicted DNA-binding transcriptional regulator YafY